MSPGVLLLGGSLARPSHTGALLRAAEGALARRDATVHRWDVAERPLPPVDPLQLALPPSERHGSGSALAQSGRWAEAIVLASPVYHNSYSGAVKNALDHLSAAEFRAKPVALLSHSGRQPSPQAVDHLRLVVRALLGIAIPTQVITVDQDYVLEDGSYRLAATAIVVRLESLVEELLWLAACLSHASQPSGNGAPFRRTLAQQGTSIEAAARSAEKRPAYERRRR